MEQEPKHGPEHKMCDWCGNEYGRKYSWLRLVVAILIGLFIFSAGYHLGELNVLVHSQTANVQMNEGWTRGTMHSRMMMDDGMPARSTTIVVPATDATLTPAPQQ